MTIEEVELIVELKAIIQACLEGRRDITCPGLRLQHIDAYSEPARALAELADQFVDAWIHDDPEVYGWESFDQPIKMMLDGIDALNDGRLPTGELHFRSVIQLQNR